MPTPSPSAAALRTSAEAAIPAPDAAALHLVSEAYRTYLPLLYAYGNRIVPNPEWVEDAIHDLFLDLWGRSARLNDIRNLKPYLLSSLRYQLLGRLKRERVYVAADWELTDAADAPQRASALSALSTLSAQADDNEVLDLKPYLERLPARQREMLFLRYIAEMSYDDIADAMGLQKRTVYNQVHNALKNLKVLLADVAWRVVLTGLIASGL